MWLRQQLLMLICAGILGSVLAAPAAGQQQRTRVTVFGDSAASSILFVPQAQKVLAHGVRLQLQLAECRRLVGAGCSAGGKIPPQSVLDVVRVQGRKLGPAVIVAVGYNDFVQSYQKNMEAVLAALKKAGVKKVLWQTLHLARHSEIPIDDAIKATAKRHPEVTVIEWNRYSRSHPSWFRNDGIHLTALGAVNLATFMHKQLVRAGVAAGPKFVR